MAVVSYTAKRSLTGGASAEDPIVLDLSLSSLELSRDTQRSVHKAMGGARETVYFLGQDIWSAGTKPSTGQTLLDIKMFLDSVESGQQFQFSAYQTTAESPLVYQNVYLDMSGYTRPRMGQIGGGGGSDYFAFNFRMAVIE